MKRYILPLLLLPLLSCHDYRHTTYEIGARVVLEDKGAVSDVELYMFGVDHRLAGHSKGSAAAPFDLTSYNSGGPINIVAWGNVDNYSQSVSPSEPQIGTHFADHRVELKLSGTAYRGKALSRSPRDLFYGTSAASNFPYEFRDDTHGNNRYWLDPIRMNRLVSGYNIIVRNIRSAFGDHAGKYRIVVTHPYSAFDFAGQPVGQATYFMPTVSYDSLKDELTTVLALALPTGTLAITIEIYADDLDSVPIYTTADDLSAPLMRLQSNKMHQIVIDHTGDDTLIIDGASWDENYLDQPF